MKKTDKEIELMAYRLIRSEAKRLDNDRKNASELGMYVQGVVDLQTEIYAKGFEDAPTILEATKEED